MKSSLELLFAGFLYLIKLKEEINYGLNVRPRSQKCVRKIMC